jgi:hypothetical protein
LQNPEKPESFTETTDEEWAGHIEGQRALLQQANYLSYRENFAALLTEHSSQAAHLFSFLSTRGLMSWGYLDIVETIDEFIAEVGEDFAKKSFYFISKINIGSAGLVKDTFEKLIWIIEMEGEEKALDYLRYSYAGAKKKRRSSVGLKLPKTHTDTEDFDNT